ncbi:MAG: SprT-like domain-containing protein [Candidatus Zixiibacteriota bacterium]
MTTQVELFDGATAALPDEAELQRRFTVFNADFFASELPAAQVGWSNRMRIAGTCDRRHRVIRLSRAYHEQFPGDVNDTLKHEMIHLMHAGHDAAFRAEAERIGASVHCREYPGLHPRARLTYICPHCRTVYHRVRHERLFCGRCARTRLDERFMLVLRPAARGQKAAKAAKKSRHSATATHSRRPGRPRQSALGDLFASGVASLPR